MVTQDDQGKANVLLFLLEKFDNCPSALGVDAN